MEMSRKEDAAVKELSRYILKLEGGVEHIYEVQMLLVEMLIYQVSPINSIITNIDCIFLHFQWHL